MWDEIAAKKAEFDAQRPLAAASIAALDAWFDVELTYTSNAIEGNTLTRSETAIVLEKGVTVRGKPLKDHLEAIDHKAALDYVRALATEPRPITELDTREIHRLVLLRSHPDEAGAYSQRSRQVLGSRVVFPSPVAIPALMRDFGAWLATVTPTPGAAFEAHARLVTIHPFTDGNGRTARLLMNLLLLKDGYPAVTIGPEHRPDYLDALETRQLTGDGQPFEHLMLARLLDSLNRYLDAIRATLAGQQ